MAEFNAMDTAAFKGVWVFCEQREGQIQTISYQLLSEGRKLANDLGVELCGVVMGSELNEDYVKALGGYGADRVYNIDSPLLKDYTTDGYAKALCDLIMEKKPEIMLIGATNLGRDLGPRCAARLHTGLTADCTHLDVDVEKYKNFLRTTSNIDVDNTKFEENTNLKMTRPAFGGHLMATIICPRFRPQMSTVRPGVMQTQPFDEAGAAKVVVEKVTPALTAEDIHVEVLDIKKSAEKLVDLIGADVVVAVGRGISADPDKGIKLAEELAGVLGGVVGASRAVTDEAGCLLTIRSARPARPCIPASTLHWASPVPSSTLPVCRIPRTSSPSTRTRTPPSSMLPPTASSAICTRSFPSSSRRSRPPRLDSRP